MKSQNKTTHWLKSTLLAVGLAAVTASSVGCQVSVGGQTLPSPNYYDDDVQYFASGSEFQLPREAAALKKAKAEQNLRRLGGPAGGPAPAGGN